MIDSMFTNFEENLMVILSSFNRFRIAGGIYKR